MSQAYEVDLTKSARCALAEQLPLDVSIGASEFTVGPLAGNPYRVGKPLDAPHDGIHTADAAIARSTPCALSSVSNRSAVASSTVCRSVSYRDSDAWLSGIICASRDCGIPADSRNLRSACPNVSVILTDPTPDHPRQHPLYRA